MFIIKLIIFSSIALGYFVMYLFTIKYFWISLLGSIFISFAYVGMGSALIHMKTIEKI